MARLAPGVTPWRASAAHDAAQSRAMALNRGMASVTGCVHRLNVFRFQEAATREAVRVAKRDGLVSPWLVEVVVYNDDGPPSYLATVCDGRLVAWEEKDLEEAVLGPGEPLVLDPDRMSLYIGITHEELEEGLAAGEWIVLMDEKLPGLGRIKAAATAKAGVLMIGKWRDENEDGHWVWIETYSIPGEWMERLEVLLGRRSPGPRGSA